MPIQNLLYKKQYTIHGNEDINIIIPTVGQILDEDNEDDYYRLVTALTAMPIDLMCQLDDVGIDFTSINEYELFLLMFPGIKEQNTSLVFGDLDLTKFKMAISDDGSVVLIDDEDDIKIDRATHSKIAEFLRKLHHIEKNRRKPANIEAKKYMLERARAKMKRRRNHNESSQLESLIVAMVNTEQYKYNFEDTKKLSIYQFNESVRQVIKKVDYDNRMYGVYAGTVNVKDLSQDDLNWLTHK